MPLEYKNNQDKRAKEVVIWLWWNWKAHGGRKPRQDTINKATTIAKENKLSDEELEEIYERWSSVYMPKKVIG